MYYNPHKFKSQSILTESNLSKVHLDLMILVAINNTYLIFGGKTDWFPDKGLLLSIVQRVSIGFGVRALGTPFYLTFHLNLSLIMFNINN